MSTLYGTSLPPGLESSTKGELRIRIDKLILDDVTLKSNPLLQASFAEHQSNISDGKVQRNVSIKKSSINGNLSTSIEKSSHQDKNANNVEEQKKESRSSSSFNNNSSISSNSSSKRNVSIPIDYCSISPHFWGEAKPSASCIPATPHQLQRGAITIIYLVKINENAFAEYLHNMTHSSHKGLHLDVFVPSSYSGRKPIFVGQCIIDLDDLVATKHLDGWFTLVNNTTIDVNELQNIRKDNANSSINNKSSNVVNNKESTHLCKNSGLNDSNLSDDKLPEISTSIPIGRVKVSFQLTFFSKAPVRLHKKISKVSFLLPNNHQEKEQATQSKVDSQETSDNNTKTCDESHVSNIKSFESSVTNNNASDHEHTSKEEENNAMNVTNRNAENKSKEKNITNKKTCFKSSEQKHEEYESQQEEEEEEEMSHPESEHVVVDSRNTAEDERNNAKPVEHVKQTTHVQMVEQLHNTNSRETHSSATIANGATTAISSSSSSPQPSLLSSSPSFASTLDELLYKSKLLRDRMSQAITLDSKVNSVIRAKRKNVENNVVNSSNHNNNSNTDDINNDTNHIKNCLQQNEPNNVVATDSISDDNDEDDVLYTSELSDEEDRLLELEREQRDETYTAHTPMRPVQPETIRKQNCRNSLKTTAQSHFAVSSAQPTPIHRSMITPIYKAMSLPVGNLRRGNVVGGTLVELNFSNLSFAANAKTASMHKLRINVKLSADITTATPTAGPFSSFVHSIPLSQPSICLSFEIQSYSEDVSRLVIEFFKVSTAKTLTSHKPIMSRSRSRSRSRSSSSSSSASCLSSEYSESSELLQNAQTPKQKNKQRRHHHHHRNDNNNNNNNSYKKNMHDEQEYKEYSYEGVRAKRGKYKNKSTKVVRNVTSEELLGLCIVGLYSQSRTITLRDPVGDVVNVYSYLQLTLRHGNNEHYDNVNGVKESMNYFDDDNNNNNNNNNDNSNHALESTRHTPEKTMTREPLLHRVNRQCVSETSMQQENTIHDNSNNNLNRRHFNHEEYEPKYIAKKKAEVASNFTHVTQKPSEEFSGSWASRAVQNDLVLSNGVTNENNNNNNKSNEVKCSREGNTNHTRLRVEVVSAQDIPLVSVENGSNTHKRDLLTASSTNRIQIRHYNEPDSKYYTKPNTFCVIDEMFMNDNFDNKHRTHKNIFDSYTNYANDSHVPLCPVENWYVESYTNGYYDRSTVILSNQRPQYNYTCVVNIPHHKSENRSRCNANVVECKHGTPNFTDSIGVNNSHSLLDLRELRLTVWHYASLKHTKTHHDKKGQVQYAEEDISITNQHKKTNEEYEEIPCFDSANETEFWAQAGELGECVVDLQPLRYLSKLDGYYEIFAKKDKDTVNKRGRVH